MKKPTTYKAPSKSSVKAGRATGKVLTPKNDTSRGKILTQDEARKEQLKKNKKPSKGSTGYSGVNRV